MANVVFIGEDTLRFGEDGDLHTFSNEEEMEAAFRKAVAEGVAAGQPIEGDEERAVACGLSARVLQEPARKSLDVFAVQKDLGDSRMIAWYPDGELAAKLAALYTGPGALAAADLHLTLLYLGDPDEDGSGPYNDDLIAACTLMYARSRMWKISATVSGIGRFVTDGDTDVIVALIDSVDLNYVREGLKDSLSCESAIPSGCYSNWTHGFIPHITLGYVAKGTPTPGALELTPFTIETISYTVGTDIRTFPVGYNYGPEGEASDVAVYNERMRDLAKAGRVLSGKNLSQMKAAMDAMQAVIDAEEARTKKTDEATTKEIGLQYTVQKADASQHYTFGPLYAPDTEDAHGEFTDAETLQKAVWDYVRSWDENGRGINLQHEDSGSSVVGEAVEVVSWPYESTVTIAKAGEDPREVTLPAGTVYMGVVWDAATWPDVEKGKIGGLSLGGRAMRVVQPDVALPPMGDMLKAKAEMHDFEGEDGAACEVCDMPYDSGQHYGSKNDPKAD